MAILKNISKLILSLCSQVCTRAPARHLDAEHPQVLAVKAFVARCSETHGVNKRLIANFDQVWTVNYKHSSKVLHKPTEHAGVHKSDHKPSMQKMMSSIRQALMIEPVADPGHGAESTGYQPEPVILDAQANVSPIEGWRYPRTTTTLSWSDGELGASWITVKEGTAPHDVVQKLNEDLAGLLTIHVQDSKSHMWNSGTLLHYLEFLTVQLRMKRLKHGLSVKDRALIFCDKAAAHAVQAFSHLRSQWEHENSAILCNGHTSDTIKVPPGWGAAGAPNDGFHQYYHLFRQSYQKVAAGQGRFMKLRVALEKLDLAVDGSVRFTMLVSMILLLPYLFW